MRFFFDRQFMLYYAVYDDAFAKKNSLKKKWNKKKPIVSKTIQKNIATEK